MSQIRVAAQSFAWRDHRRAVLGIPKSSSDTSPAMGRCFFLVVFVGWFSSVVVAADVSGPQAGGPIDVYLIGGQSNATGQGYMKNLPPDFKIDTQVLLFHSGKPHLDSGAAALTWIALRQASESPDRFGPELGFGNRIAELHPAAKIALIKHAHSGTNLYSQWNPGADSSDSADWGPQFKVFVATVNLGLKGLRDQGYAPTIRGMIWQQGESDHVEPDQYGQRLAHFIARVREQFDAPDLRFVYGYVYPPPCADPDRFKIRAGQHAVDQNSSQPLATKNAFVVPIDDLNHRAEDPGTPLPNDFLHLGTSGQLELGRRMAEKMAADDTTAATPSPDYPATVVPSDSNDRAHPQWNKIAEQHLADAKGKRCDILFIGDSITQNFDTAPTPAWDLVGKDVWDKYYANRNAVDFGVGADKTQNVLWRMENMDIAAVGNPQVAVILIGINNSKDSAADIILGIEAVLNKTQITFKGTKIILVSVTPSNRGNDKFSQVNAAISKCADNRSVFYLDLFSKMAPVANGFEGVGRDHVHLTEHGYELWAAEMEPLLVKLLKP
jgi:lysophospholipase L1-like esterase